MSRKDWSDTCPNCGSASAPAPTGSNPNRSRMCTNKSCGYMFTPWPKPNIEPVILRCPKCLMQHIDRDEWATKPHRTHLCAGCKHEWRPAAIYTVGVESL